MIKQKYQQHLNNYSRYSGLAFQMIAVIVLGVFGGYRLDQWLKLSFPVFVLIFSLVSVILAIYLAIKEFIKK